MTEQHDQQRAEQYRREAQRLYSMADAANHSTALRGEFFRMARMYEALSLQADSSQRRGMVAPASADPLEHLKLG